MSEAESDSALDAAERRGFSRGLNLGLVSFSGLCTLGILLRSWIELPKFEAVFRGVKVQMPALTILALDGWPYVVILLAIGIVVCIHQSLRRGTERRTTVLNILLFVFSLGWWGLTILAIQAPFWSVLEGIGSPRR